MMERKNQLQTKHLFFILLLTGVSFFYGCTSNIVDSNLSIPERKWTYRNILKTNFEIKDSSKLYNIYFKLRHTDDYRYANLFVVVRLKEDSVIRPKRYQFKLAKEDGEWLGSGSGNLFTYTLPLFTSHKFSKNRKYEIEIEQNMRDNPLAGISDIGVLVEEVK
jgi:gliding motility-associated lipoprotein GldH